MDDSGNSLPRAPTSLDNIHFWTPTITNGAESATPSKQKHGPSAPPSPDSLSFPVDGGSLLPSSTYGQTLDQPIPISSDTESDKDDATDGSDLDHNDGGQSDTSLDSLNTLSKKIKSRRGNTTRRASLDSLFEDTDSIRPPASPSLGQPSEKICVDGESLTGSSSLSFAVPSTPQEHDARRSCEARSRSTLGSPDRSMGTASASSSRSEAPEVSSQSPSPSSAPEGQGIEMSTGTPCETEVASPKQALGTSRRRPERLRRTSPRRVKSLGGYAITNPDVTSDSEETSASTGSHDKTRSDDESYPSHGRQGVGDGVDEADDESDSPPPKRRKQSQALASSRRKCGRAALSVGPDVVNSRVRAGTSELARGLPSPPSSHYSSQSSPPSITGAKFEEWSLPNAALKRITLGDGRTTFQLQFDWDPRVGSRQAGCPSSNGLRASTSTKGVRPRGGAASSAAYTPAENEFIISLKEGQGGRNWATIHREFNEKFPGRTKGSLQVHYCTKLKDRTAS